MSRADVLALIPARVGSKGIPNKNFRPMADGPNAVERAIACALAVPICEIVVCSDCEGGAFSWVHQQGCEVEQLYRPYELAHDDTPMIAVVQHALDAIPGPDEQIVVLLQPTQPLRQPKHITQAVQLLRESEADSVVSVAELPRTHHPNWVCLVDDDVRLFPWDGMWWSIAQTRQELEPVYLRDGTVYAFWRQTVTEYESIYGLDCRALIIPADETCALDTEADWQEAERRLRALSEE